MATLAGSGGVFDFSSLFTNLGSGTTASVFGAGTTLIGGTGLDGSLINLFGTGGSSGGFSTGGFDASFSGGMGGLFSTSTGSTLFGGTGGTLDFNSLFGSGGTTFNFFSGMPVASDPNQMENHNNAIMPKASNAAVFSDNAATMPDAIQAAASAENNAAAQAQINLVLAKLMKLTAGSAASPHEVTFTGILAKS